MDELAPAANCQLRVAALHVFRVNDPTFWRAAEIVKRVAGDQRQISARRFRQYLDVGRTDDLDIRNAVPRDAFWSREFYTIVRTNQPERSKVGVAMCGDPKVAALVRERCRWDVTRPPPQNRRIISFEDYDREIQPGDTKPAYDIAVLQAPAGRVRSVWKCSPVRSPSVQPFSRVLLRAPGRLLHPIVGPQKSGAPGDEGASQPAKPPRVSHFTVPLEVGLFAGAKTRQKVLRP